MKFFREQGIRKSFIFIFCVQFFASGAQAGWSPAARVWAERLKNPPAQFQSGMKATVWAVAKSYFFTLPLSKPHFQMVPIESKHFQSRQLNVAMAVQQDDKGNPVRSPLLVFLPGVFGNAQAPSVLRAIENFGSRGYHVVGIPNPWSPDYLTAGPRVSPGHEKYEAGVVLHLIQKIKQVIGEENISAGPHLMGESYGGFLATGVLALDQNSVIQGTVTALGPPLHRDTTMQTLDAGYERVQQIQFGYGQWQKHLFLAECMVGSAHLTFSTRGHECAESMLYHGFHAGLFEAALILHARQKMEGAPRAQLGFKEFFEVYSPRVRNNPASLVDWIHEMSEEQKKKLRFMTAEDDLVNDNVPETHSWQQVSAQLHWTPAESMQRVIVLTRGGHVGFVGLPEFQDLLDVEYGPRIKGVPRRGVESESDLEQEEGHSGGDSSGSGF